MIFSLYGWDLLGKYLISIPPTFISENNRYNYYLAIAPASSQLDNNLTRTPLQKLGLTPQTDPKFFFQRIPHVLMNRIHLLIGKGTVFSPID
jgi:hypothetical protein